VAANNRAVAWVNLGERATIRGATKSICEVGRYLWLMVVTWFRAWSPLSLVYVVFFVALATAIPGVWQRRSIRICKPKTRGIYAIGHLYADSESAVPGNADLRDSDGLRYSLAIPLRGGSLAADRR